MDQHARAGFSLLELSIVIAIIGLLVGGLLGTRSYLRNAELVSSINEAKAYLSAAKQFERMYGGAIPGDMANASSYWSGVGNGDGNMVIGEGGGNLCPSPVSAPQEYFRAFQHLSRAGLINGNYTGVAGGAGVCDADIGVNVPRSSIDRVGYTLGTGNAGGTITSNSLFFGGFYGTFVVIAKETSGNALPRDFYMTSIEGFELDSKYDNGMPTSGVIRTSPNDGSICVTMISTGPDVGEYNTSNTNPNQCIFILTAS